MLQVTRRWQGAAALEVEGGIFRILNIHDLQRLRSHPTLFAIAIGRRNYQYARILCERYQPNRSTLILVPVLVPYSPEVNRVSGVKS